MTSPRPWPRCWKWRSPAARRDGCSMRFLCTDMRNFVLLLVAASAAPSQSLSSYDRLIPALMEKYGIAGASVAVSRNGRLVLARGYGYADKETHTPVEPDALFRIASLSKPITSVTILKLVEDGKLDLDAKALEVLSHLKPAPGARGDPRFRQ